MFAGRTSCFNNIFLVNAYILYEFVINIPIIHGKSQGREVSYSVGHHDNVSSFTAVTLFWVSWRAEGSDDLLKHIKGPLAGGKCSFISFPAVSTDVILTELTVTEQPFYLPRCTLIDLLFGFT